jgi:hypothetical protein
MSNSGLVKITLTKQQADWLTDHLSDIFDSGSSDERDERFSAEINDKLDTELVKLVTTKEIL